mgnify:CR=1 FL=1
MLDKINKKEKEGGFIQIIVLVVIALLVMKYYGITITIAFNWFKDYFSSVLQ